MIIWLNARNQENVLSGCREKYITGMYTEIHTMDTMYTGMAGTSLHKASKGTLRKENCSLFSFYRIYT